MIFFICTIYFLKFITLKIDKILKKKGNLKLFIYLKYKPTFNKKKKDLDLENNILFSKSKLLFKLGNSGYLTILFLLCLK
jgi:hypothetical protein